MLINHCFALLNTQTCEWEHADLSCDVRPIAWNTFLLNGRSQSSSHIIHALTNHNKLFEPLLAIGGIAKDRSSYPCSMCGWWRISDSHNDLRLRQNSFSSRFVSADKVKCSSTFTIEAHNLSKGLGNYHFKALFNEIPQTESIFVHWSRSKSLVSGVKEWVKLISLAHLRNFFPLLFSWINTSWVMGACVQQNGWTSSCIFKISDHASKIQTFCLGVEVSVGSNFKASCSKNRVVVTPSWVA